jgi:hypothetical protein
MGCTVFQSLEKCSFKDKDFQAETQGLRLICLVFFIRLIDLFGLPRRNPWIVEVARSKFAEPGGAANIGQILHTIPNICRRFMQNVG